jgi:hypothetical protein
LAIKSDHTVTIFVKYGGLDEVLDWCGQFCVGNWDLTTVQEQAGYSAGVYEFEFEDDRDVTIFELRWG